MEQAAPERSGAPCGIRIDGFADIVMLVIPGGQERTAPEYDTLLAKAGLRMTRVVPTESPVSIVEAVLA